MRLLGLVGIDALGAVPDGGWSDLDRNLFERLASHSPAGAVRAEEIDQRAMVGEASDAEMRESLALVWPYYFARPEDAPPCPDFGVSIPLYAGVVASVHEHFERGTLERGLPDFGGPFLLIHGEADPLPIDACRKTADLHGRASVVALTDAGHFPWLERPDAVRSALTTFLAA